MKQRFEGQYSTQDHKQLFYQSWRVEKPEGTVLVVHGFAEHSDCYERLVEGLTPLNFDVWSYDMRGHGKSAGARGYVRDFEDYVTDLKEMIDFIKQQPSFREPFVVVAHSMGGLTYLRKLIEFGAQGVGIHCLSSPFLGFALKVPAIKDFASHLLASIAPKVTLDNGIVIEHISRDGRWVEQSRKDFLRHQKIAAPTYLGMRESMAIVKERVQTLKFAMLFQIAGDDKIVNKDDTIELFQSLPLSEKKMIVYKDSYHEIFNDLNREEVYRDLIDYIRSQI